MHDKNDLYGFDCCKNRPKRNGYLHFKKPEIKHNIRLPKMKAKKRTQ